MLLLTTWRYLKGVEACLKEGLFHIRVGMASVTSVISLTRRSNVPLLCSSEDKFARDPFNENASQWMLREITYSDRFG